MPNNAQRPLNILYFARLGEQLGRRDEQLSLPVGVQTLAQLREHLINRGGPWQALADTSVRTAVNQEIVKHDLDLQAGDEVAFFPPVTGG